MEIQSKSDRMGQEPIIKLLFRLSAPAIVGMIIQAMYNIVDSIYVGRLSTDALSALSISFPVQMVLIAVGVGTGVGTSSLISRLLGQGDNCRANNVAEHVFFIAIIYGIIGGLVGVFFAEDIIKIFTDDPVLIDLGYQYINIILTGSMAVFIPATFNYILRGEGNTFLPMMTMIIGAVLNMIIDPFLIFGLGPFPQLGVAGAAYATIFSRAVGGVFIIFVLFSDKNELTLKLEDFKFDFQIIKEIYNVGIPAMANRLLFSIAVVFINLILGAFSSTAIAVMGLIFRMQSFFLMMVFGLTQGYLPIVGYNFGHNNPERMKKTILIGNAAALSFGVIGFAVFQLFPEVIIKLFNSDPKLLNIGVSALKRVSLSYFFMVLNIIGVATFQAVGKGMPSFAITFLRQAVFLVPGMYILGEIFGLDAVWYSFPIAELTAFIIMSTWLMASIKDSMSKMRETV
ncbi:putative efflux protein, MATE family [Halanaerobium congolense]|jgi:putative MATE family efflux protein|uniref:Efflux protein, MATE family n=1 Tax=Halanaerobium congolense TaxID=54121 RepID=A0A1G6QX91_9FIRM|nr:MATE family efflux transporter [Halanaerobium congolense]KXS48954.1 MAG: MATE efflux family protein [Halanaerobium sp. T82-1]PUU91680.1 MAG: MATE efflux family protein [Halanaerobium sp.]PTX15983.1 putative MATE family efflux protein [Halanaerobium congolense]PXV64187.1 putative MATE family efflux protein [Halanaerobium congolense]TDP19809.1 putative MATE family efflux protein [Halanaerobium congolense]